MMLKITKTNSSWESRHSGWQLRFTEVYAKLTRSGPSRLLLGDKYDELVTMTVLKVGT